MRTRRRCSAPANDSSLSPSGNGITAASVMAGGPPTKMLTRSFSPAPNRRLMVHADAAMDLIVEAHFAIRLVLHCPPAARGTCPGWTSSKPALLGMFRVDLRQRDEGAAVVGPALELRQVGDATGLRQHGSVWSTRRGKRAQRREGHPEIAQRVTPGLTGIDLELHDAAHGLERIGEQDLARA